ncbi:hypothetical protein OEZ86_012299 [Tetradesmus obliquus]|nr:hypothetical protein OEZ86_012299 [Tetradesmus obliquus]
MDSLTIAGPTLAALLHSLLTNGSPCDGLLFGSVCTTQTTQAHDSADALLVEQHEGRIAASCCCTSMQSFYTNTGDIAGDQLDQLLQPLAAVLQQQQQQQQGSAALLGPQQVAALQAAAAAQADGALQAVQGLYGSLLDELQVAAAQVAAKQSRLDALRASNQALQEQLLAGPQAAAKPLPVQVGGEGLL